MRMPLSLAGLTLGVALASPAPTSPEQSLRPTRVTGVFTNLHYNEDGGDVVGLEVLLIYTRAGYMAVIQIAEGVPEVPVVVPVQLDGSQIAFSFPAGGVTLQFRGTVGPTALEGRFNNGAFADSPQGSVALRRGKSYWQ